jgi:hypothetical protein
MRSFREKRVFDPGQGVKRRADSGKLSGVYNYSYVVWGSG